MDFEYSIITGLHCNVCKDSVVACYEHAKYYHVLFVYRSLILSCFDLILYVPVNNLSVMLGWVFLG